MHQKLITLAIFTLLQLMAAGEILAQSAGTAPTGNATITGGTITVAGNKVVGTNVDVQIAGSAEDKDCNQAGGAYEDDTFSKNGAYAWSEQNNKGTFSGSGSSVTYTTPNTAGTFTVVLKVKDDGKVHQDNSSPKQVATVAVTVVDPDGIKGAAALGSYTEGSIFGTINFQVTYQGKNLPWKGRLAERTRWATNLFSAQLLLPFAFSLGPNYDPSPTGFKSFGIDTLSDGTFADPHGTSGVTPFIVNGKYRDASIGQWIARVSPTGGSNTQISGTLNWEEYVQKDNNSVSAIFKAH